MSKEKRPKPDGNYQYLPDRIEENMQSHSPTKTVHGDLQTMPFKGEIFKYSDECPICLVKFIENETIMVLPCDPRHYFHVKCIQGWLEKNAECPICTNRVSKALQDKLGLYTPSFIQDYLRQVDQDQLIEKQFENAGLEKIE